MDRGILRGLREEDANAVAGLFALTYEGARDVDPEEIRSWLRNEDLNQEWLRVLEIDGRIMAYGDLMVEGDDVVVDLAAPGHEDRIIEWAEETAREHGLARVRVVVTHGHSTAAILERRGYLIGRSSYRMEKDLAEVEPPGAPEGFEFCDFSPELDAAIVREVLNEAFEDDPTHHDVTSLSFRENYLKARGFDPSLWTLAWDGDRLAGFVIAFPQIEGNPEIGWVSDLGVRSPWRRRGLGEALLQAAFHDLATRGLGRARLGVDTENIAGALRLYERVGMTPVTRWDNWIFELDG